MLAFILLLSYVLCGTAVFFNPRHTKKDWTISHSPHGSLKAPRAYYEEAMARRSGSHSINGKGSNITISPVRPAPNPCPGNSPDDRSKWCDHDIDDDWYSIVPDTHVTREYWLDVNEVAVAPDGYFRAAMAINGSIPGPTIYADWGDEVVIHVTNHLHAARNGTSIHWHGIRQHYTNQQDGVVSITQCPISPGSSMTYRWRATQYGTSWYHSHIGLQAWEGVFGGIVINGPATANYDEDKGVMFLTDWSHPTVDEKYQFAQVNGPPHMENALINGMNVYVTENDTTGARFESKVTEGHTYRLRLVNSAIDTHFKFMIDNHELTVIAMDLVPIKPFTTKVLSIGIAQRYDVIVKADQSKIADSFWMRAIPQSLCSAPNITFNVRGILHYGDRPTTPKTLPWWYQDDCDDEDPSRLVPHLPLSVSPPDWEKSTNVTLNSTADNLFRWYLNSTTLEVLWEDPTLMQIHNKERRFPNSSAVIPLPEANKWIYFVIQTNQVVTHPIHLHGHDFWILAQGCGHWNGSLTIDNPPRRDTAMLPSAGHLVIAFKTDNPGAWLMHCHIGWHTTEGFALQFLEREEELAGLVDYDPIQDTCDSWVLYDHLFDIDQEDSGV